MRRERLRAAIAPESVIDQRAHLEAVLAVVAAHDPESVQAGGRPYSEEPSCGGDDGDEAV